MGSRTQPLWLMKLLRPHYQHTNAHGSKAVVNAVAGKRLASTTSSPAQNHAMSRDEWYGKEAGSKVPTKVYSGDHSLQNLRDAHADAIAELPEKVQLDLFRSKLQNGTCSFPAGSLLNESISPQAVAASFEKIGLTKENCLTVLKAALATTVIHAESRVASLVGEGFYTIGPGGEELTSVLGLLLRTTDSTALHYRYLGTQIARQLKADIPLEEIFLERARAHTVSSLERVTGGVHCALGGTPFDFYVTSTLASHAPPAVGRALGASLANMIGAATHFPKDFVSFFSVGDGSVNNAHFLAAANLAEYAQHRNFRCPVVMAISDNDLSISLKGYGWLTEEFVHKFRSPVFRADGTDLFSMWSVSRDAIEEARKRARPVALIFEGVPRRFGHAATDRQSAYLSDDEISQFAAKNPLEGACAQAVAAGYTTYQQLSEELESLVKLAEEAFNMAVLEPKNTSRQIMNSRVSQRLASMSADMVPVKDPAPVVPGTSKLPRSGIMRKQMTGVFDELLGKHREMVYIGEDVAHGGYYVVTDKLHAKYPFRVRDFPPDETTLIGAGIGFSQAGLTPIVEIPYSKYLDCGADMFYEAILMNWATNGQQPNGMIIRLQGFDKGVFGGNFHTHNMLHMAPGLDVVCYSNGADYVRGMRYAYQQAKNGRVVMSVDSTQLLSQRHLYDSKDDLWRRPYPGDNEYLPFEDVIQYKDWEYKCVDDTDTERDSIALVAYGNCVPLALRAAKRLHETGTSVTVIDTPYLSNATTGLVDALSEHSKVVFADPCKLGQNPYAGIIVELQQQRKLPKEWSCVAAQPTYNPLGTTFTFTSEEDIMDAAQSLLNPID